MMSLAQLEKEVEQLKERNRKVDSDKHWEVSLFRRVLLLLFTYFSIGIYLAVIKVPNPWLNAVVPAIGFMLSTLTLPFFKFFWLRNFYRR